MVNHFNPLRDLSISNHFEAIGASRASLHTHSDNSLLMTLVHFTGPIITTHSPGISVTVERGFHVLFCAEIVPRETYISGAEGRPGYVALNHEGSILMELDHQDVGKITPASHLIPPTWDGRVFVLSEPEVK